MSTGTAIRSWHSRSRDACGWPDRSASCSRHLDQVGSSLDAIHLKIALGVALFVVAATLGLAPLS
jgi:hypothetical protein